MWIFKQPGRRETALALIKGKAEQYPDEVVKILSNISLVDTQTSGEDSEYLANFLSNYMNNNPDDKTCATALAKQFNTAMVGWGKDKDFVIAAYNNMSESAREAVRNAYQEKYGKSLINLISSQMGLFLQIKPAPETTKSQTEVTADKSEQTETSKTEASKAEEEDSIPPLKADPVGRKSNSTEKVYVSEDGSRYFYKDENGDYQEIDKYTVDWDYSQI